VIYVNGRRVVINSGVKLTTCGIIDLAVAKHSVLFKYIHDGGYANASVTYRIKRSEQEEQLPLLPLDSVSPGWCSGTLSARTKCFGSPGTDQCQISFPAGTAGGEVVQNWSFAISLQAPLEVTTSSSCVFVRLCVL
jgi:hypothetical protein